MGLCVVPKVVLVTFKNLTDDNGTVLTGIGEDLPRRSLQRLLDDVDADFLIIIFSF